MTIEPTATSDQVADEYELLLFGARQSVRYHRHRQRFLDRVHHAGAMLTTFGGCATLATVLADLPVGLAWMLPAAAVLTAFAGATEAVFGPARGARRYDGLARDFIEFEQRLLRAQPGLTAEKLIRLHTRRLDIEATEPPIYRLLNATCHDEVVTSLDYPEAEKTNISWWQRWVRNISNYGADRIHKRSDVRRRNIEPTLPW